MKITQEFLDRYFTNITSHYTEYSRAGTIGVITDTQSRAEEIFETLLLDYKEEDVVGTIMSKGRIEVQLVTGDVMLWATPAISSKGCKFKGVIFDGEMNIKEDILNHIILPMCIHCTKNTAEIFTCY